MRQVHNFTNQNKFPAWGFAPKPVETRKVSTAQAGTMWALSMFAACRLEWHQGHSEVQRCPFFPHSCLSKDHLFESKLCPTAGRVISICSLTTSARALLDPRRHQAPVPEGRD